MNFKSAHGCSDSRRPHGLSPTTHRKRSTTTRLLLLLGGAISYLTCSQVLPPPADQARPASTLTVLTPKAGGPIRLKSAAAEFVILPSGYVQGSLLKGEKRLTLDEPEVGATSAGDYLVSGSKEIRDFTLDFDHVKISDTQGKLGAHGKRVEIVGRSSAEGATAGIEKTLTVEIYDDFPTFALTTAAYKNLGDREFQLDQVITQRHRLNATQVDPSTAPYELWSFQGSSYEWGKDEILPISKDFSRPNLMGGPAQKGLGGGIPVVDFWTAKVGLSVGHLEPLPLVLSIPVKVASDGRIEVSVLFEPKIALKPGEVYQTPRCFVAVHEGDFYEPLSLWSQALQRLGWSMPKPSNADYAINWCGWGYETNFTPAQMLGTIPKLKELGIKWATLDYCWFDNFGDWQPRKDTFPGDTIKRVVDEFHKQGFLIQLWWQPIAVEDGRQKHSLPKPGGKSELLEEHPDWLILDESGKPAQMISPVSTAAALCPALPEVQEYHKRLTERFVRDWGFDGHKMDSVFTVPPCYNPKHHHRTPNDSINGVADVYKVIFQTTRTLKPESVTQICPCGTTPNLAWLPYEDQAVTADPVGSVQVRRRIKMYKALMGPQAAVYGDHVELSGMKQVGQDWLESGRDFASTIGPGGVVGTKFTWPGDAPRPKLRKVKLTPDKEALWKKWIDIYNSKMLSRGTFLNLYTLGYDVPEGYAIEKDGKMYYAFFAPQPETAWKGEIELRSLRPGQYRVLDYENGKPLGTVDAQHPRLNVNFVNHLLLEASK
jgi:alpha-galactosidase